MQRFSISALLLVLTGGAGWMSLVAPNVARADFYAHPWTDFHDSGAHPDLGILLSYLNTANNFDSSGHSGTPVGFQNLSRFFVDVDLIYPITPEFSIFGRLDWMAERLNSYSTTGTGASTGGSGYGLGDQTVGGNFRLFDTRKGDIAISGKPRTTLDLQGQVDFPGYKNATSAANSTPTLGDGSVDITGGAFGATPITTFSTGANLYLFGGIGYTYRSQGYSGAVPFQAGLLLSRSDTATDRGQGIYASVEATGFYSLSTDTNPITVSGAANDGGSFIVNAVNPTFVAARGDFGFQTNGRIAIYGYFTQSVWGENAPLVTIFGGGLRISLGGAPAGLGAAAITEPAEKPAVRKTDHEYGKSNQGFVSYDLEAHVSRINDRLNLLKIDRGAQESVTVGQMFDIFSVRQNGQIGDPIARARVTSVKNDEAALTITEYFREVLINEGFIAKRLVQ